VSSEGFDGGRCFEELPDAQLETVGRLNGPHDLRQDQGIGPHFEKRDARIDLFDLRTQHAGNQRGELRQQDLTPAPEACRFPSRPLDKSVHGTVRRALRA
jgi:hypothetical protein